MNLPMLTRIDGALRDYPWGVRGGISEVLGRAVGPVGGVEAEYWYSSGGVLLKILAAAQPLSLQVHPSAELAGSGFDEENAAGIPIDDPRRNFKDRAAPLYLRHPLLRPLHAGGGAYVRGAP